MTDPHNTGEKLRGRPFANGHDPRRNAGGRPQGLSRLAREAVGDGEDLIAFYLAILKGDAKALGVRQIRLQDRMEAARWFGDRGWGKTPILGDLPEEPEVSPNDDLQAWVERLPPDLRRALGEHMDREFERQIEVDIAIVDEQIKAQMPEGWSPSRPTQPLDRSTKVPE